MKELWVEKLSSNSFLNVGYVLSEETNRWDEPIEVEDAWWERYKELAREFNSMQLEAARLAGYEEDE